MLSLVMLAVVLLIVPVITKQVPLLKDQVPALLDSVNTRLVPLLARFGVDLQVDVSLVRGWMQELITGHESELIQGLLSSLRIGGSALAAVFGNLILAPIVAYYLLLDWANLVERSKGLIPPRWRAAVQGFLDETDAVLGQYLRGQLLVMGVLAVFYTVGLALVGLKLALPIGVFTGLAVFIPYLGLVWGWSWACWRPCCSFRRCWAWRWWRRCTPSARWSRACTSRRGCWANASACTPSPSFLPDGLWAPVWLRGRADCLAGQRGVAGGDPPGQEPLPVQ
ncbi:sporulation integral membrane protein YtvI [Hydrogenophaga sp. T4]|nr:sporulation integral membrane protein YtvI [Hydrogenophaga sp. T4]